MKAIYAGSFDPLTNGHLNIIKRSLDLCEELVIAIGYNSAKTTAFSVNDRMTMLINATRDLNRPIINAFLKSSEKIAIARFEGLLVNYAQSVGANVLIRGVRSAADYEYELNLAHINKQIAPQIETIFLPTSQELSTISSSMVKEIAKFGGDVSKYVPRFVNDSLKELFAPR